MIIQIDIKLNFIDDIYNFITNALSQELDFLGGRLGQGIKSRFVDRLRCFIENCSKVSPLPYAVLVLVKVLAVI
jgi:hypothetical protein